MPCEPVRIAKYPSKGGKITRIIGIVLIVAGVILIILCVPLWAWLSLIGAALMIVGLLLLRKSEGCPWRCGLYA